MTWHATGKSTENGKIQHSVDGKSWKNFDTRCQEYRRYTGKEFKMIAMLLWTINDFHARSSLSGWSGQGGVIMVEDDHDIIHDNNSSNLTLSTSLNDLDFVTLNIDGQSTKVVAPQDIIVVDDPDDFIDDKDGVRHDLADFDDEFLTKAGDDDEAVIVVYSSDEED
nr:hypothetical protein [Tanacetum cinerariifolium]